MSWLFEAWVTTWWPWISSWMQTSGFAGAAAVIAASIAVSGVRRQTRLNAWWQRAEWALDLLTRGDATDSDRDMAYELLRVLQKSRLARREEQKFLRGVVTADTLDLLGDGDLSDDLAPDSAQPGVASEPQDPLDPDGITSSVAGLWARLTRKVRPDA